MDIETLLINYSEFLERHGYTDSDWRDEKPFAPVINYTNIIKRRIFNVNRILTNNETLTSLRTENYRMSV